MTSFHERLQLTEIVEQFLYKLFSSENIILHEFGVNRIVGDNVELNDYLKEPEVNQQESSMIVKFAPDFILVKKNVDKQLYFLDVKHSTAPTWSPNRLKLIKEKNKDDSLAPDRIGVVAREALLSYRRYFPNTIILMACPYNRKLLMAQFAKDVRCLYCYHSPQREDYDCECCPWKNGGFFDIERATNSIGSQTPMTNVDLDSFLPADEFFKNQGIVVDNNELEELKNIIKSEPIHFDDSVYSRTKNQVMWSLNNAGCDWIDYEVYSYEGNPYYHLNRECSWINGNKERIAAYASINQAKLDGKKDYCRTCFPTKPKK